MFNMYSCVECMFLVHTYPPVHVGLLQPAQHGCVREGSLKDDNEDGKTDGDGQAQLNSQKQSADEGSKPDNEVSQVGLQQS